MAQIRFYEQTNDHGTPRVCCASDNNAEYVINSARAKDLINEYWERYGRDPVGRWYHRHINFTRLPNWLGQQI